MYNYNSSPSFKPSRTNSFHSPKECNAYNSENSENSDNSDSDSSDSSQSNNNFEEIEEKKSKNKKKEKKKKEKAKNKKRRKKVLAPPKKLLDLQFELGSVVIDVRESTRDNNSYPNRTTATTSTTTSTTNTNNNVTTDNNTNNNNNNNTGSKSNNNKTSSNEMCDVPVATLSIRRLTFSTTMSEDSISGAVSIVDCIMTDTRQSQHQQQQQQQQQHSSRASRTTSSNRYLHQIVPRVMMSSSNEPGRTNKHGGALVPVTPLLRVRYRSTANRETDPEASNSENDSSETDSDSSDSEEKEETKKGSMDSAAVSTLSPLQSLLEVKLGRLNVHVDQPFIIKLYDILMKPIVFPKHTKVLLVRLRSKNKKKKKISSYILNEEKKEKKETKESKEIEETKEMEETKEQRNMQPSQTLSHSMSTLQSMNPSIRPLYETTNATSNISNSMNEKNNSTPNKKKTTTTTTETNNKRHKDKKHTSSRTRSTVLKLHVRLGGIIIHLDEPYTLKVHHSNRTNNRTSFTNNSEEPKSFTTLCTISLIDSGVTMLLLDTLRSSPRTGKVRLSCHGYLGNLTIKDVNATSDRRNRHLQTNTTREEEERDRGDGRSGNGTQSNLGLEIEMFGVRQGVAAARRRRKEKGRSNRNNRSSRKSDNEEGDLSSRVSSAGHSSKSNMTNGKKFQN